MMAEDYSIKKDARFVVVYRITDSRDGSVEGTYKGMAAMGAETAFVFETSDGIVFLNASSIVSMKQTAAAPEEPKKPKDESALYG